MTIQKILIGSMCAVGFVLGSSRLASATSFALNQSACCGTGPFGTITLSQYDVNSVNVLVNLNAGIGFVDTGNAAPGNHPDLAWTLLGDPAGVSISLVQTGGDGWTFYDRQSHPVNMSDSFGKY